MATTAPRLTFVEPMNAAVADAPPYNGKWLYEVKFDGFRVLAIKNGKEVELWSRNEKRLGHRFPGQVLFTSVIVFIVIPLTAFQAENILTKWTVVQLLANSHPHPGLLQFALTYGLMRMFQYRTTSRFYTSASILAIKGRYVQTHRFDLSGLDSPPFTAWRQFCGVRLEHVSKSRTQKG